MKRIYSSDGTRSLPAWIVLTVWIVAAPILLPWAFLSRLGREVAAGLRYAWLDVREEIESARRTWKSSRFRD
jgi:hypothetical protein